MRSLRAATQGLGKIRAVFPTTCRIQPTEIDEMLAGFATCAKILSAFIAMKSRRIKERDAAFAFRPGSPMLKAMLAVGLFHGHWHLKIGTLRHKYRPILRAISRYHSDRDPVHDGQWPLRLPNAAVISSTRQNRPPRKLFALSGATSNAVDGDFDACRALAWRLMMKNWRRWG